MEPLYTLPVRKFRRLLGNFINYLPTTWCVVITRTCCFKSSYASNDKNYKIRIFSFMFDSLFEGIYKATSARGFNSCKCYHHSFLADAYALLVKGCIWLKFISCKRKGKRMMSWFFFFPLRTSCHVGSHICSNLHLIPYYAADWDKILGVYCMFFLQRHTMRDFFSFTTINADDWEKF